MQTHARFTSSTASPEGDVPRHSNVLYAGSKHTRRINAGAFVGMLDGAQRSQHNWELPEIKRPGFDLK